MCQETCRQPAADEVEDKEMTILYYTSWSAKHEIGYVEAVRRAKLAATQQGRVYSNDKEAFFDFVAIHHARIR